MKRKALNLTIGVLLAIVFGLWLFVFKVRQSEIALVTTFGNPAGPPIDKPGVYLKWPWPIQRVHTFDQRIQNLEDKLDESQTADGFILLSMVYVGWQITDPAEFYPKFAGTSLTDPERDSITLAQGKLADMLRSAKSAAISKHRFGDLISTDAGQFKFEAIEGEMLANIQAGVRTNHYGIEVKYLGIKRLGLPPSTTTEVFNAMKSDRAVLVADIKARGDREAAAILQAAKSTSDLMLADAEAQAKGIRGQGLKQAAASLAVFQQDTNLANFLLKLEALKSALGKQTILILGGDTQPFDLMKAPDANGK